MIYDTVFYENLITFDGHTSAIRDVTISKDDLFIATTCETGYIFLWNLNSPTDSYKPYEKKSVYNKIIYDKTDKEDLLFACTNEKICVYQKQCKELLVEFLSGDFDSKCAALARNNGVLFVGTSLGTVRIMNWPIKHETLELETMPGQQSVFRYKSPEVMEYSILTCPISYLEISPDENNLFVGGDDGTVVIFKVLIVVIWK